MTVMLQLANQVRRLGRYSLHVRSRMKDRMKTTRAS